LTRPRIGSSDLWNTYSFFVTYANADGWDPGPTATAGAGHVLDRWIRSRLHGTVREVGDALEAFDALRAAQSLDALVDDLSNWYVRRSRPRFWNSDDDDAHVVLHECLLVITQLLAPFCPFLADAIYQDLAPIAESVHLSDWPMVDVSAIDEALEHQISSRAVVSQASARPRRSFVFSAVAAPVLLPDGSRLTESVRTRSGRPST
jgi:isoleucyl-tRNA synthetase